jgi:ribosomal protein S18 acetylase RimI-like enzyme
MVKASSELVISGMTFRHPTSSDHPALVEAWRDWSTQPLRRDVTGLPQSLFVVHFAPTSLVAESHDGEIVGFLIGFLSQTYPDEAYVHFIGIRPDHRRRRLGLSLYERFFDIVRLDERRIVRGVTSPKNTGSIAFHREAGFELDPGDDEVDGIPLHRDHDGPGIDMVLLRKDLDPSSEGGSMA